MTGGQAPGSSVHGAHAPLAARIKVDAQWVSPSVLELMRGPRRQGHQLGHSYVAFGDYVVLLTPRGGPKLPNGIGLGRVASVQSSIWIGDGYLEIGNDQVSPGPIWDPVPRIVTLRPEGAPCDIDLLELAGRGEGLTPSGDDVLIGYLGALVLVAGEPDRANEIARLTSELTTALSATLIRHAARGELPEPVHRFLADGDTEDLLALGHSSGRNMLLGLQLGTGICNPYRR